MSLSYRSDFYIRQIIRANLIGKFNYVNSFEIVSFRRMNLFLTFITFSTNESYMHIKILVLLEFLSTKKGCLKSLNCVFHKQKKAFVFIYDVVLRKNQIYDLIDLLNLIFPIFEKRYLTRNLLVKNNSYSFFVKDLNVFWVLPDVFYKWDYNVFFNFLLKNPRKNSLESVFFCNHFYLNY